ncbi:MAG: nucleotidyl transferase AbiEii/AbiGii toxin family protein [Bacilli bacterium]
MINLSQKNVVKIAKETNFIKDNVEKVMRLADILEFVFSSKWKDKLVLKGGTAINLFYRELPRLSVDIDLDYIGETKEEVEKIRKNFGTSCKWRISKELFAFAAKQKIFRLRFCSFSIYK